MMILLWLYDDSMYDEHIYAYTNDDYIMMILDDLQVTWQRPLGQGLAPQQSEFYLIIGIQSLKNIRQELQMVSVNLFFHPSDNPWCF